jgi:hypothetical protein
LQRSVAFPPLMNARRAVSPVVLCVVSACVVSASVFGCVGDDPSPVGSESLKDVPDSQAPGPGNGPDDGGNRGDACTSTCNSVCVDTDVDPKNCGRCGHDCGNGKCAGGVCQPVLIAGDANGSADITSIATDQALDNPKGLATQVLWSVTNAGVFQDSVTGGNTIPLSTDTSDRTHIVVDQNDVFWFDYIFGISSQPILKTPLSTAGTQSRAGTMNCHHLYSLNFDSKSQNLFGTYIVGASKFGVFKCARGNDVTCTSVADYDGEPGENIASDGNYLYFTLINDPLKRTPGIVLRLAMDGSSSETYALNQADANLVRVEGANVFWNVPPLKTIRRGPLGTAPTPQDVAVTPDAIDALAADSTNVYWTESATGTLRYAPITGAGPNTAYVTLGASPTPMRLVRDTGFLYFSHKGGIYRVALP